MTVEADLVALQKRLKLEPILATLPDRLALARAQKLDYALQRTGEHIAARLKQGPVHLRASMVACPAIASLGSYATLQPYVRQAHS
jgi:hypothetical protein